MKEVERRDNLPARRSKDQDIPSTLRDAILEASRLLDAALPPGITLHLSVEDTSSIQLLLPGKSKPRSVRTRGEREVRVTMSGTQVDVSTKIETVMTAFGAVVETEQGLDLEVEGWQTEWSHLWRY